MRRISDSRGMYGKDNKRREQEIEALGWVLLSRTRLGSDSKLERQKYVEKDQHGRMAARGGF